eukprot:COSAG01_NODE_2943_length_6815_cov_56.357802_2_plen_427_part_00
MDASSPANVQLRFRPDPATPKEGNREFFQWFYFRASGISPGTACTFRLINASGSLGGTVGWTAATADSHPHTAATNSRDIGYRARYSYDRQTWLSVPDTSFDPRTGVLSISITPAASTIYLAYHEPYSLERHHDLIARCCAPPSVEGAAPTATTVQATHTVMGQTLDGRDMDLLTLGSGPLKLWIIGRQHPGETMASWFMEGLLHRITDPTDSASLQLLRDATLYVVPNMNPDGSYRGHLRTNGAGANLNREWATPSAATSPEVLAVRTKMEEVGLDFCLDVHGDEGTPYNYVVCCPAWTERLSKLQDTFWSNWRTSTPDFSVDASSRVEELGEGAALEAAARGEIDGQAAGQDITGLVGGVANLTMCPTWLAWRFDCLAMTLELPFKDNAEFPQPHVSWSGPRSIAFGRSVIEPLLRSLPHLRDH